MLQEESLLITLDRFDELTAYIKHNDLMDINCYSINKNVIAMGIQAPYPLFYIIREKESFIPKYNKTNVAKITSISVSPCGLYAISGHDNGSVLMWDISKHNSISEVSFAEKSPIKCVKFLNSKDSFIVAMESGEIHLVNVSSLSLFVFLKANYTIKTDPIDQISFASSFDDSISMIAVSSTNSVKVFQIDNEIKDIYSCKVESSSKISLICDEWQFFLAIANNDSLSIRSISENGTANESCSFTFDSQIIAIGFVSPLLLAVHIDDFVLIVNNSEEICAKYYDIPILSKSFCTSQNKVFFLPYGTMIIEGFESRIRRLMSAGQFSNAIELAVSIYSGESNVFDCVGNEEILQELLKLCILMLIESSSFSPFHYNLIAESITKTDISESIIVEVLERIKTIEDRLAFLVAILESSGIQPVITTFVLSQIAEIAPIGNKMIEDALMKVHFTPSSLQQAISVGNNLRFSRFVLHLFYSFFNDILPAFALIVDGGDSNQIAELTKYVFLEKAFDASQANVCIVWLHAPDTNRLEKAISSDWENSHLMIEEFLSRAPIKFSSSQSLTLIEMLKSVFMCFKNAKPPLADQLFLLIAQRAIVESVKIPSGSVQNIIEYIFSSSIKRDVREALFLRIVDIDYPSIEISQFKYYCVKAGFSCVVQRLANGDDDMLLVAQSRLLSDNPEDALQLLEQHKGDKDRAQEVMLSLFRPLLYLNPQRTVKLVFSRFKNLHPNQITKISQKPDIKLYFDTLFSLSDPPLVTNDDTHTYLRFLSKHTKDLLVFLRSSKNISCEAALSFCELTKVHIGCSVLYTMIGNYNSAFKYYQDHIQNSGTADFDLSKTFLENLSKISEAPSVIIRTLIDPIIPASGGPTKLLESILSIASGHANKIDFLVAVFSLYIPCNNTAIKTFLQSQMEKFGKFIIAGNAKDIDGLGVFATQLTKKKNEVFSDGLVSARDYGFGVSVLSTTNHPEKFVPMPTELSAASKSVLQRTELFLIINKMSIPQDEDTTIILMTQ